jgi:hypothetical protein
MQSPVNTNSTFLTPCFDNKTSNIFPVTIALHLIASQDTHITKLICRSFYKNFLPLLNFVSLLLTKLILAALVAQANAICRQKRLDFQRSAKWSV